MIVAVGSATATGDVNIFGELHTEEALVYAKNDVSSRAHGTVLDVTGVITASRNIDLSNFQTTVTYTHTYPDVNLDMVDPSVEFISWNK
jgi:hypothetical protein